MKQFSRLLAVATLAAFVASPALAQPKPKPKDALGVPGGIIGTSTASLKT